MRICAIVIIISLIPNKLANMKILHTLCLTVTLVVCISCSRIDPVDLQSFTQYALIKNVTGEEALLVLSPYKKYPGAE